MPKQRQISGVGMGMGFAPTWLRQVSPPPLLHKTTLTTGCMLANNWRNGDIQCARGNVVPLQAGLGALAPGKRRQGAKVKKSSAGLRSLLAPVEPDLSDSQHKRIVDWVPPPEVIGYMEV